MHGEIKNRKKASNIISSSLVIIPALINLFPLYWMICNSFKYDGDALKIPPEVIPLNPTFTNYIKLFTRTNATIWLFNSIFISVLAALLVCILSSLAGYGFAKKQFWGRDTIFFVLISTLMIPSQLLLVPLFTIMLKLKLTDTYIGMVLPILASPFGVFLLKQFIQTIPSELIEATRIDGCSEMGTFIKIILPLSKPGIGALAIFTFVRTWNDYLWQLVMVKRDIMKTLQIGIASLQEEKIPNIGYLMAGATIAAIPMIIFFLTFQKYFTKGITMGAIKG